MFLLDIPDLILRVGHPLAVDGLTCIAAKERSLDQSDDQLVSRTDRRRSSNALRSAAERVD